jgi:CheY-like chemotaxis protein
MVQSLLHLTTDDNSYAVLSDLGQIFDIDAIRASTTERGILSFSDRRNDISLVVIENAPPAINGYSAICRIRQLSGQVPIVMFGDRFKKWFYDQCMGAGCTQYLSKPVSHVQLLDMLERHTR